MYPTTLCACAIALFVVLVGVRSQSGDGWNVEDDGSTYDDYRPRRRPNAKTRRVNNYYRPQPRRLPRPDDMTRMADYLSRFYGENTTRAKDALRIMQFVAEHSGYGFGFRREWPAARPTVTVGPIDITEYDFSGLASNCPPGFQFVSLARSCYKVIYEGHNWTSADQRCRVFHHEAHLVAITTNDENSALKTYLRKELAKNLQVNVSKDISMEKSKKMLWTSGRQMSETNCEEPFVWKVTKTIKPPLSFTYWRPKEPNCSGKKKHCIQLLPTKNFRWKVIDCSEMLWPLCEYDPM